MTTLQEDYRSASAAPKSSTYFQHHLQHDLKRHYRGDKIFQRMKNRLEWNNCLSTNTIRFEKCGSI